MKKRIKLIPAILLSTLCFTATNINTAHAEQRNVYYDSDYDTPKYVIEHTNNKLPQKNIKINDKMVIKYFNSNKTLFKLNQNASNLFEVKEKKIEGNNIYFKVSQTVDTIPIYSSDIKLSFNRNGNFQSLFGKIIPSKLLESVPNTFNLSSEEALKIVKEDLDKKFGSKVIYDNKLIAHEYIYEYDNQFYLTYIINVSTSYPEPSNYNYVINAENGSILSKKNHLEKITGYGNGISGNQQKFEVKYEDNLYQLVDTSRGNGIETFNAKNLDRLTFQLLSQLYRYNGDIVTSQSIHFNDPAAVDAHAHAIKVYDYYEKKFDRNSFDNKGHKITSTVHVGENWNNASWNGAQMVYGDGDGKNFRSLSGSLDIVAHELTHAVIQHSAGLAYEGEAAALNESLADIMAVMVDRNDWTIGEDVYTPNIDGDFIRSLKDPTTNGYPDHYSKKRNDSNLENNHFNSTINSKAAHLISEGGTHYGVKVNGVGKDATEQIFYKALTNYLVSSSDFHMMRQAALQSATDLYGENSKEYNAVLDAYKAIGIE